MRGISATLTTSNSGHDTSYVVITGDSISSGESGRYLADYEAANWNNLLGWIDYEKFCKLSDLACTNAAVTGNGPTNSDPEKVTKVKYSEDTSLAYEKGTEGTGECHRAPGAPGTWLARYFKIEAGQKVDSINLACSGATTKAMTQRFLGQRPQGDDLKDITDFLSVPYVTNTMGANDIGFSTVAIACYLQVAKPFLEKKDPKEPIAKDGIADLLGEVVSIVDAPWNAWFGYEDNKKEAKFEKVNPYCSDDPKTGGMAEKEIKQLPTAYKSAMNSLLDAAPDSQIVAHNYPNLIPHNSQSGLPRNQALADDSYIKLLAGEFPPPPNFDTMSYEQLKENRKAWADAITGGMVNAISGSAYLNSLLATANILYTKDMNWAAWKMIPSLDEAVFDTAKSMGGRVQAVDVRQLFNGREYSTAYKGAPGSSNQYFQPTVDDNLSGLPHMGYTTKDWTQGASGGYEPQQLRASFVTAPLAGVPYEIPVFCPSNFTVNGEELPAGRCPGAMNEPLHPNWRGQAAQGQCLVAVVTGMLGGGDSCVRSVGANETKLPVGTDLEEGEIPISWLNVVENTDMLCVFDTPRTDYPLGAAFNGPESTPANPYQSCTSALAADPTWDKQRWSILDGREWK